MAYYFIFAKEIPMIQGEVVWLHSIDRCGLIQQILPSDCKDEIYFSFDAVQDVSALVQGVTVRYKKHQVTTQGKTYTHATDVCIVPSCA